MTVALGIGVLVCALGWLNQWVACAALAKYMMDKEYETPSDEEAKRCAAYVWNKLLRRQDKLN